MAGASITNETTFTSPAPFFPLTGLPGPVSIGGEWGLRQIWNAGRADAVVSAVDIALAADQTGFQGKVQDTNVSVINFALTANPGAGGLFPNFQPLPAEPAGLSLSDFDSPEPDSQHQLLESSDLKSWQPVAAATFVKTGNTGVRATVNGVAGDTRFCRMALPGKSQ